MKYKYLLSNGAQSMRDVMGYFRRAAKQADSSLARAVTDEREFIFEPLRILYMLYASGGKGWAPPVFRPEGLSDTSWGVTHPVPHGERCGPSRNPVSSAV